MSGQYDEQGVYKAFVNNDPSWIALKNIAYNYAKKWHDSEKNRKDAEELFKSNVPFAADVADSMSALKEMASSFIATSTDFYFNHDKEKEINCCKIAEIGYLTGLDCIARQIKWLTESYDYDSGSEYAKNNLEKYLMNEKKELEKEIKNIKKIISEENHEAFGAHQ